jgi:formamidopyrimidine-DNA glycosylase
VLEGARIARAQVNRPDLRWPFPPRMAERLTGARVDRLGRRSKYILADLDTGETLIVHLGMSGRMIVSAPDAALGTGRDMLAQFHHLHPAPEKHDHVILDTEDGRARHLQRRPPLRRDGFVPDRRARAHIG